MQRLLGSPPAVRRRSADDPRGQTMVEYGVVLALLAVVVIVALIFLGPIVSETFSNTALDVCAPEHVNARRQASEQGLEHGQGHEKCKIK